MAILTICLITNNPRKAARTIATARNALRDVEHEIVVAGVTDGLDADVAVPAHEAAREARVGHMRNLAAEHSSGDVLIFCDDDVLIPAYWYQRFEAYGTDFDLYGCRILLPGGTRYWDYCSYIPHRLVPYDRPIENQYLCGCFLAAKRHVWQQTRWDDGHRFVPPQKPTPESADDVDFSVRAQKNGYQITFDSDNLVWHWDFSYRNEGWRVRRVV